MPIPEAEAIVEIKESILRTKKVYEVAVGWLKARKTILTSNESVAAHWACS